MYGCIVLVRKGDFEGYRVVLDNEGLREVRFSDMLKLFLITICLMIELFGGGNGE